MSEIDILLSDPYGYEVAWDYCLENNLTLPNDNIRPRHLFGASQGGTYNTSRSYSGAWFSRLGVAWTNSGSYTAYAWGHSGRNELGYSLANKSYGSTTFRSMGYGN